MLKQKDDEKEPMVANTPTREKKNPREIEENLAT